jgi:hypothetical protein
MALFSLKAFLPTGSADIGHNLSGFLPRLGKDIETYVKGAIGGEWFRVDRTVHAGEPVDLDRVKVDITIKDTKTGDYLEIPVIPEKVNYTDGQQISNDFTVIGLGGVSFPNGVALDSVSWQSFFPGRHDPGYVRVGKEALKKPVEYRNILSSWKDAGTVLQVIIPTFDINKQVTVKTFTWDGEGFEGDIYYSLELQEYKKIEPKEVAVGGTVSDPDNQTQEDRPAAPDDEINDGEAPVDNSNGSDEVPTEDTGGWRDAGASQRQDNSGMGGLQAADRY